MDRGVDGPKRWRWSDGKVIKPRVAIAGKTSFRLDVKYGKCKRKICRMWKPRLGVALHYIAPAESAINAVRQPQANRHLLCAL